MLKHSSQIEGDGNFVLRNFHICQRIPIETLEYEIKHRILKPNQHYLEEIKTATQNSFCVHTGPND